MRATWILEALGLVVVLALLAYRARAERSRGIASLAGLGRRIVVRDRGGFRELVFMSADGAEEMLQARVSRAAHLVSGLAYTDGLHLGALAAARLERALFLGGGPVLVPRQFLDLYPGVEVSVAELDPAVVDVARGYFSVAPHPRLSLQVGDGRAALEGFAPGSLDVIVVDAFGVGTTPQRLSSAPFFALCHARLRPGGSLVVNFAGALVGQRSALLRRVYAGIEAAFGASRVAAFGVPAPGARGEKVDLADADNTLALAQKGAPLTSIAALAERARRLPRAMLPCLDAILALRFDVDTRGLSPLDDPKGGRDDALTLW